MDWLFNPLADFFLWSFTLIEAAGMNLNYVLILIGFALILYWFLQIIKNGKNDKGFFKKEA